jgi:methylated-DNA-[protein]-cysteine S-methyltransferase
VISPFVPPDRTATALTCTIDSPCGKLLLTSDGSALTGLYFMETYRPPPVADDNPSPDSFREVIAQLDAYFSGELTEFSVPLAPRGSAFQLAVWAELTRIPFGVTSTYGEIALALGKSLVASRAVGAANGSNPIPIIVPCHRVIGADGGLTGYGGGLDRKLILLKLEGSAGLW